jgi:hypothetical protein
MPTVSVELRNVAGTEAALGWASAHTIVVHRPEVMRAAVVWGSTASVAVAHDRRLFLQ